MRQLTSCLAASMLLTILSVSPQTASGQTNAPRLPARAAQRPPAGQPVQQAGGGPAPAAPVRRASGPSAAAPRTAAAPPRRTPGMHPAPAGPVANVPAKALGPKEPFTLTEAQQKLLDQVLLKWEKQSDKVKTFSCTFTRWEYDQVFGNPADKYKKSEGQGEIRFKAPDTGLYLVKSLQEFDPGKKVVKPKTEGLDHWTCDGKAIWEYNAEKKQLIERRLPAELQGKAISEGPLPFVFGAKAEQLKRRYWLRDVTPVEEVGQKIWLEAIPRFQQDAANFRRATIILNDEDCMPFALSIQLPGGKSNTDYLFASGKTNGLFSALDFAYPKLSPLMIAGGWKHVVEEAPAPPGEQAPPPVSEPIQAKRGAADTKRK
jgi:TIGR03009 family protein